MAAGRSLRPVAPHPARRAERGRRAGLVQGVRRRVPRSRQKGGADTGPSPVDRRKTGSKHHLICDGCGTPLKVIPTAANVNDVTQALALDDGIPSVADRLGRPRRWPEALLGVSEVSHWLGHSPSMSPSTSTEICSPRLALGRQRSKHGCRHPNRAGNDVFGVADLFGPCCFCADLDLSDAGFRWWECCAECSASMCERMK
ncbi:transposase [Streptomyces flaveolus]|uniref:transposase n=1 Tax=Streptomyces flaveolus TaxID=67297 RepID=UPI0033E49B63